LAAADGYSYLPLLLVAGITIFAVGMRFAIEDLGDLLSAAARLALCGGVALYLVGHVAFRLRVLGRVNRRELIAAGAVMLIFGLAGALGAWLVVGAVALVIAVRCAVEARPDAVPA
jgi:low temperature requirement protein LtrA